MHRPIGELPSAFFGSYREPPPFAFIERNKARLVLSESDVFVDVKTVWQFHMPGWEEYAQIRAELREAGFESESSGAQEQSPGTQMTNGERWISIAPSDVFLSPTYTSRTSEAGVERSIIRPEIAGVRFHVHYEERFATQRRARVIRDAIADGRLDIAMPLYGRLPKDDLPALVAELADYPIVNPFEALVRVVIARRAGDREAALAWLRRAVTCSPAPCESPASDDFEERLSELADELDIDLQELTPRTRADYLERGFVDLETESAKAELGVGSMLLVRDRCCRRGVARGSSVADRRPRWWFGRRRVVRRRTASLPGSRPGWRAPTATPRERAASRRARARAHGCRLHAGRHSRPRLTPAACRLRSVRRDSISRAPAGARWRS